MSGFGGFGGFGQNNNTTQQGAGGFGGFGSSNTTNTGFGSGNTGFGATNNNTSGGGLFGSGGSGGFGSSGGAFGGVGFGAPKPATGGFGAPASTSGGSIFGGGTSTTNNASSGFGGFGQSANASTGFGAPAASTGGLFGASKPAFGAAAATSSPFGGATNTGNTFGASGGAFGAPASTALGGATGECQGTGAVPFQAFVEKEPSSTSNQQNSFQSISFQQPYQKWSPEELRLADYTAGRKNGNGSNQPGAFGASTGFGGSFGASNTTGGFGSNNNTTGGGLFGNNNASTSSPFGASQPAATGFGSNTATAGGGLFGAKPAAATGGLFGSTTTPAQPATGGMFGSGGGFGSTPTPAAGGFGAANTGGSLFGNNNNSAAKPFSFGNTTQPAAGGTGFGASTTGGFGSGTGGGGLFGNNTQQNTTSGFGQQPAATNTGFGGFGQTAAQPAAAGNSLFGNTQAKPAGGLFGAPAAAANTGGGLFGNNPQPAANNNPFGGSTATQNTSGLFGAQKPAGGSLFGNPPAQTNTGGGLFGGFGGQNQNNTQQQGNSLFGGLNNNNNQQKPSLFTQPQQPAGNSLFGNTGNQQQGSSLFGGMSNSQQNQPQPQNSLFGGNNSTLGNSQQGQQNSQSLTASISDNAAYGGASLFSSLQSNQINNPGPIATPLSSSVKQKKNPALPLYKLNSASTSRFSTPQKRGFGFSYSNYGTPGSASSTSSTPGTFSSSSFGSTLGRTLKTSMSTSSLRRSFGPEDSILAPGAFSSSPSGRLYGSTGSVKKLNINRNLRTDLFTPPPNPHQAPATPSQSGILKKRVSFNDTQISANGVNTSSPLKNITNGSSPSSEDLGFIRPAKPNGKQPVDITSPEMQQVQGNELAIVHEEGTAIPASRALISPASQDDQEPGDYWMKPSLEEISQMNFEKRKQVTNFVVGREGVGQVSFKPPIDFTIVNPDEIINNIVRLTTRSCTVYSDENRKPAQGKGLNVPSTISLQNSWPRKKDHKTPLNETNGARFKKHMDRLRRVPDTKFVAYDKVTGVWTFEVEHFTTYGDFDDENETDGEGLSELDQSTLSAPPDTPTPKSREMDQSFASTSQATNAESDLEDTFDFKNTKGKKVFVPGAFGNQETFVEDDVMEDEEDATPEQSFLGEGSVGSQSEDGVDEPMDQDVDSQDDESVSIVDQEMAGSYPQADNTAELEDDSQDDFDVMDEEAAPHNALVRARLRAVEKAETPAKKKFAAGNDWTAALRKTVSPKKQDRAFLKSLIHVEDDATDFKLTPVAKRVLSDGRGFATSIDLMNSLFGPARSPAKPKVSATGRGFELPYTKRAKTFDNSMSSMTEMDRAFHECMKPSWGPDGTLIYSGLANAKPSGRSSRRREKNGLLVVQKGAVVSEGRDVRFAKFSNEESAGVLGKQKDMTIITTVDGVPFAKLPKGLELSSFCDDRPARDPAAVHEQRVWQLASILWDPLEIPESLHAVPDALTRLRRDKLSSFWETLVDSASSQHVALAKSDEEKAIASLSGHKVADACGHLINGKNFHLATLIATIGNKESVKRDIREQLQEWQKAKVLSEFSQPIRALYELLAGNVCICAGSKGGIGEDKVESFGISKRFGLDWRQALGLRLWYGSLPNEPIENTVFAFEEDLTNDKETAKPQAWYVEEKIQPLWEDEEREERQDLLWGLLKFQAFQGIALESVIAPSNSQLSPLDFRLSWQLSRALTNVLDSDKFEGEGKSDELTLSFASQLTNEGSWLEAVFVLLHLSSADVRARSVQKHLAQFAGRIGSEDSQTFNMLTQNLRVPPSWIWEAKALYMRSVEKNPQKEVECLIKAGSFDEAHLTFAKEVAPKTVVELDYEVLRSLLGALVGQKELISEWHLGGQIYFDFLELVEGQKKAFETNLEGLDRLLAGLPAVVDASRKPSFMETVAVKTMSAVVAKQVVAMGKKGQKVDLARVLRLPLTEDNYLRHTIDLSVEYYRTTIFASATASAR